MIYDMHNAVQNYTQLIRKKNNYKFSFLDISLKWHTKDQTELVIIGTWKLISNLTIESIIMNTPLNKIYYVYSSLQNKQYILSFTVDNMFSLVPLKKEKSRGILIGKKIKTTSDFTLNFKVIIYDIRGKENMINHGLKHFRPYFLLDKEKELLTTNLVIGQSDIEIIMKANDCSIHLNEKTKQLPFLYPKFDPKIEGS